MIRNLRWDWIDFDAGTMRRRAPRANERKNKRAPIVKLGRRILSHLRRWRRLDGPKAVYVCERNGATFDRMWYTWGKVLKLAGLDDSDGKITPHIMRHSRATWLMQKGIDPWEAAGHLGMNVQTLIEHLRPSPSQLSESCCRSLISADGAETAPFRHRDVR